MMMKLFTASAVALFALTSVVGCSSSDKGGVAGSSTEALSQIQNPTGTFDKSNGSQAFAGYSKNKDASGNVAGAGGAASGGGTTAQSIRFLANSTGNCAQDSECACPGGGSFKYEASRSNDDLELKMSMNACVFDSGDGFTGDAIVVQSKKPLVDDSKLPAKQSFNDDGYSNLLAMEGDVLKSGGSEHVKLVYLQQHGWQYLSVEVPSGSLVIGLAADGDAVVIAKNETWVCSAASGKNGEGYSCKSTSSQEEVDVDSKASSTKNSSGGPVATEDPSTSGSDSDSNDSDF